MQRHVGRQPSAVHSAVTVSTVVTVLLSACAGREPVPSATPSRTAPPAATEPTAEPTTPTTTDAAERVEAPESLVVVTTAGVHLVAAETGQVRSDVFTRPVSRPARQHAVAIDPNGTSVYVTAENGEGGLKIHRVELDGASAVVTAGSDPALSPDGSKLAYAQPTDDDEAGARRERLVVRHLDSGQERVWQDEGDPGLPADLRSLSWASDSRHLAFEIVFEDGSEVRILDTTQGESVRDARELEASETTAFTSPAYRGTLGTLAVVEQRGGPDPAIAPEDFAIVEVNPDTGKVQRTLTEAEGPVLAVDFDPTGRHLLFVTTRLETDSAAPHPNQLLRWSEGQAEQVPLEQEPLLAAW